MLIGTLHIAHSHNGQNGNNTGTVNKSLYLGAKITNCS